MSISNIPDLFYYINNIPDDLLFSLIYLVKQIIFFLFVVSIIVCNIVMKCIVLIYQNIDWLDIYQKYSKIFLILIIVFGFRYICNLVCYYNNKFHKD